MRPNRNWLKTTALAGLVLYGSGAVLSQQPERPKAGDPPRRSASKANPGDRTEASAEARSDGTLAACLIIDNNKEIALAELAQQHSQNEEVKSFAEKMVQDHRKFVEELQQIATSAGYQEQQLALSGSATGDRGGSATGTARPRSNRDADTAQSRTEKPSEGGRAARPAELDTAQGGQPVDFISLKQEVAQQCLQSASEELGQAQGEFDMHYMGAQIMAHQGMIDTLTVFAKHASPELQQKLEQGKQTAQKHLEHARRIKDELAQASPDSTRTRSSRDTRENN